MRIRWLDEDMLRAEVTIGFWWWKRVAEVKLEQDAWIFAESRILCRAQSIDGLMLSTRLSDARKDEQLQRNWRRAPKVPRAQLLKGG